MVTDYRLRAVPKHWELVALGAIAEINPRFETTNVDPNTEVSFIPMRSVEEQTGRVDLSQTRRVFSVRKGYTAFREGDILFAKITPCMENGKVAIAHGLHNGLGFGSTEFHVIRLAEMLPSEFMFYFLLQEKVRAEARRSMSGSAGQLRVPTQFLKALIVPLPPLAEQHRIAAKIEELFTRLDGGVGSLTKARALLKRYRQAVLKAAVTGQLSRKWRESHGPRTGFPNAEAESPSRPAGLHEPLLFSPALTADRQAAQEVPSSWDVLAYDDVGQWKGGGTPSTRRPDYWRNGTLCWISPKDMKKLRVRDSKDRITTAAVRESGLHVVPRGSLLFVVRSGILRRMLPVALTETDVTINQDLKALVLCLRKW